LTVGVDQVSKVEGQSTFEGPEESHFLDIIQELGGNGKVWFVQSHSLMTFSGFSWSAIH
jgi:hypothetical protein